MHTSRIDATFQRKDASTENAGIPEHEALVTVLVKHSADLQPCLACIRCSRWPYTAWYSMVQHGTARNQERVAAKQESGEWWWHDAPGHRNCKSCDSSPQMISTNTFDYICVCSTIIYILYMYISITFIIFIRHIHTLLSLLLLVLLSLLVFIYVCIFLLICLFIYLISFILFIHLWMIIGIAMLII